jgi:hypothetical protein
MLSWIIGTKAGTPCNPSTAGAPSDLQAGTPCNPSTAGAPSDLQAGTPCNPSTAGAPSDLPCANPNPEPSNFNLVILNPNPEPSNLAPATQSATQLAASLPAVIDIAGLKDEIEQLKRQLNTLTGGFDGKSAALDENDRPTFAALVAEFGLFGSPYEKLKAENNAEKLELLYYFEYLKRVKAIREETLRTIRDFYNEEYDSHGSAVDAWIAKNPMVPSAYFAGRKQYNRDLARYCIDVDFIEANLLDMCAEDLCENPALNLSFFDKHKINIGPPQIFVHDVTQAQCEQYAKSDEDFLRLAYNPRAPVKFMTDNADRVDWRVASQFNSAALLSANFTRVKQEAVILNLNLSLTTPCGKDLQYALLHPIMRFDALNDSFLVINYNCDWRQKLQRANPGPFADWKKYLFYTGSGLNRQPYTAGAFDAVVKPDEPHAVPYAEIKAEQHGKSPGGEYTKNYHLAPYGGVQTTGLFQTQTVGYDRHLKHGARLPSLPDNDLTEDELMDALFKELAEQPEQ